MSLYADICRCDWHVDETKIVFDESSKTWTIKPGYYLYKQEFPGIPDKEMARAILRALQTAHKNGWNAHRWKTEFFLRNR